MLGTAKDKDVAFRLKRTLEGVRQRRRKLGIKSPAFSSTCRRWTPEEDTLLGKMRDEEVAARTGHPLSGVLQRRLGKGIPLEVRQKRLWTTEEEKRLGILPDADIAARLNRSVKSVQARRLEKRIEMVNADAEGNVDIPGQARFPVKKNGLSADDHVRQVAFVQRCA